MNAFLSVCFVICFSSVAQYERNCPAFPLFKQSAEVPGCKDKKEKFTLTASKREVRLKRYNVAF